MPDSVVSVTEKRAPQQVLALFAVYAAWGPSTVVVVVLQAILRNEWTSWVGLQAYAPERLPDHLTHKTFLVHTVPPPHTHTHASPTKGFVLSGMSDSICGHRRLVGEFETQRAALIGAVPLHLAM